MTVRTILGGDVSVWQASDQRYPPIQHFDASRAVAKGLEYFYIKVTGGLTVKDPERQYNYDGIGAQGKRRGPYHYFVDGNGQSQAIFFLQEAYSMGVWELPPAVDVEEVCNLKDLWDFCQTVYQERGVYPLLYTNPYTWNTKVKDSLIVKYRPKFVVCDLWQAQWPILDDGQTVISLTLLSPWKEAKKDAVLHQFSSKNGMGREYGGMGSVNFDLDLADPVWLSQYNPPPLPGPTIEQRVERLEIAALAHGWSLD